MVAFRSRISDDGQGRVYEAYFVLFPTITDQENISVMTPMGSVNEPVGTEGIVPVEDYRLNYYYRSQQLLSLKRAEISFDCDGALVEWNIIDDPNHIRVVQDPVEKYMDPDPFSAEPPVIDANPLCHGVVVEFTSLLSFPANFVFNVIADDDSVFLYDAGTVVEHIDPVPES